MGYSDRSSRSPPPGRSSGSSLKRDRLLHEPPYKAGKPHCWQISAKAGGCTSVTAQQAARRCRRRARQRGPASPGRPPLEIATRKRSQDRPRHHYQPTRRADLRATSRSLPERCASGSIYSRTKGPSSFRRESDRQGLSNRGKNPLSRCDRCPIGPSAKRDRLPANPSGRNEERKVERPSMSTSRVAVYCLAIRGRLLSLGGRGVRRCQRSPARDVAWRCRG